LPGDSGLGVSSVIVTPHTGSGSFEVVVKGKVPGGLISLLTCYISTDTEPIQVGTRTLDYVNGSDIKNYDFAERFKFDFSVPGTHALVCTIQNKVKNSDWSDDFIVTSIEEPQSPPSAQPLEIKGKGTVSGTNSWGNPYSVQATSILLTIKSDNSAELYVVYTMNVDFTQEQYLYFNGTANPADGTVTFTACNFDGLPSGGTLTYTNMSLTGEYTCIRTPKGGVQEQWKLKMMP
jgi:hypothetical protein